MSPAGWAFLGAGLWCAAAVLVAFTLGPVLRRVRERSEDDRT